MTRTMGTLIYPSVLLLHPQPIIFFPYQVSGLLKFTTATTIYLLVAPTWTGTANAVAYDASCALQVMRIA